MDQQTKAALKQDHFVTTTAHGIEWAKENRKSVVTTVSLLLAVILVVVLIGVVFASRSQSAAVAFGDAMTTYETPIAIPSQPVPPGTKTFASVAERAKAANAQFVAVANKYGMTKDGRNARYFAGLTYMEQGQTQSAEDTFKQVAGGFNHELGSLANLALADLYRQTGRDQQAIDIYNQLTAKPTDAVPAGLAQIELAELYTAQGKVEQAHQIYARLKDKDAKGAAGALAAEKLNPAPSGGAGAPQL